MQCITRGRRARGVHGTRGPSLVIAALVAVAVSAAWAVDGVVEINQAKALAGGVTPGDGAGYPIELDVSGSYVLTGDLEVPADTEGIWLEADDVTLDLNGFAVRSAGGQSFADGILMRTGVGEVEIRNGVVRGFPRYGIFAPAQFGHVRVIDVRAFGNAASGIELQGVGNLVARCTATDNGGFGIRVGAGSLIVDSVARSNAGIGLTGTSSGFYGCVASDNDAGGTQASGLISLGGNLCGATPCP